MTATVRDRLERPMTDLRVSLTDRCNFRCGYCMPSEVFGPGYAFLPAGSLLTFGEIEEVVATAAQLGVTKVRLTGGEPLLRPGAADLVARLARIDGLDVAMTTNGVLLPRFARDLAAAGLTRLTVSLDALDDHTFHTASGTRFHAADVLAGIEAAKEAGFARLKINTVVRAGLNEDQVPDLIEHFRGTGHVIRFIEYMDVGSTNGWSADHVVPAGQILAAIENRWPVEALPATRYGEVAQRFRLADGSAEFGLIASVSQPFCGSCNRARITADGRLHTCLFSTGGFDLTPVLRGQRHPGDLVGLLAGRWRNRADRYSQIRDQASRARGPAVEMSYIGG